MTGDSAKPVQSLYVHVPFCAQKCLYCAFYSEPSSAEVIDRYVSALIRELALVASDLKPVTLFFGGGTPSLLKVAQWERIFRAMDRLHLLGADEWTIECNPATVSPEKARIWRDHGVNRLSLGVQSLNDDLLDRLGRIHSRETVFKTYDLLRQAGFSNLNIDLMFAIPGQTFAHWSETLDEALAMKSEHLSSYEVTYEDDTPLFAQLQAGEFSMDEDLACDMYEALCDRSGEAGFWQYEVSNFANHMGSVQCNVSIDDPRPQDDFDSHFLKKAAQGIEGTARASSKLFPDPLLSCKHNMNYWKGGSFYGLGPSATSYVRGVRWSNWANTLRYCEEMEAGRRPIQASEELSPLRRAAETAAFGLRMTAGWSFDEFQQITGFDLRDEWATEMEQLVERGWAARSAQGFKLNRQGLRFADSAAEVFLR